jgi:hypothetical protein
MNKLFLKIVIGAGITIFIALFFVFILELVNKNDIKEIDFVNDETIQKNEKNDVVWQFNGNSWQSLGDTSKCNNIISLIPPVDFTKVSSLLFPGQIRGNDFKGHGGFRFDGLKDNNVNVVMPIDAKLIRGSMYEESGEVQYMLDFISNCGVMIKFDHLLTLSPTLDKIVKSEIKLGKDGDSRTTNFKTQTTFNAGELIATQIGHVKPFNPGMDFGVYDLKSQNLASKRSDFIEKYKSKSETAFFGVCWLDYFSSEENALLKSLPIVSVEGKESEYCN